MLTWLIQNTPLLYFAQSLWRDEAFSVLAAEKPLLSILGKLTFEPPVYYTLLHFWMKLFGMGEIAARSLSLLAFGLATVVVIVWAEKLYKDHWLSWYLPLFFFTNPMLLYYAFEIRTYSWYVFFAVWSMYAYMEKKWKWYVVASVLGFYTHTYFLFVLCTQFIHWCVTHYRAATTPLLRNQGIRSMMVVGILIAPWLLRVAIESVKLKESWYFPVNGNLILSVLGNMFLGYEGTPWYLWGFTRILSLIFVLLFVLSLQSKAARVRNLFFILMVVVPLSIVIGVSFLKPLFVNRYLIPVTVAEVFLVVAALAAIKRPIIQRIVAAGLFLFVASFNFWYPKQHAKLDIRTPLREISALRGKTDLVLAESPLILFETLYYSADRSNVFLYNPRNNPFPWYVGSAIFSPSLILQDIPLYPARAFLVHENSSFDLVYRVPTIPQASAKKPRGTSLP